MSDPPVWSYEGSKLPMATEAPDMLRVMPATDDAATVASGERLEDLYRMQVLARTFDEKAVRLNRQGRLGTYAPLSGHEAIQIGATAALEETDWCFPTYRDHAMYLNRGFDIEDVIRHLNGRGNYIDRADPDDVRTLPPYIPIATQLPHAAGVGMAMDYNDDPSVALASFGDGATSEGDFHEGMNFAGVFDAPVVFLCQNNQYAISVPYEKQTASATIAQKAQAYGFEGVRVDGTDVLAVNEAVNEAIEKAKNGGGPTLVEAVTYRRGAHTTADDPGVYRPDEEVDGWEDPVSRTHRYLVENHGWTEQDEGEVRSWATDTVANAIETVEAEPDADPETMFDHVYADEHARLARQRARVSENPEVVR